MDPKEINVQFFSLVSTLASACWQQLGKTPSQIDGEVHKDLKSAQSTIDMLIMLREKTEGNLTNTEHRLLEDTISALQSNYEEEAARDGVSG